MKTLVTVTNVPVGMNTRRLALKVQDLTPKPVVTVSQVAVCWKTYPDAMYQVDYRSAVTADAPWQLFGTPIAGTGETNCVTDMVLGSQRFYRVRLVE